MHLLHQGSLRVFVPLWLAGHPGDGPDLVRPDPAAASDDADAAVDPGGEVFEERGASRPALRARIVGFAGVRVDDQREFGVDRACVWVDEIGPTGIKIPERRAALATESSTRVLDEILSSFSCSGVISADVFSTVYFKRVCPGAKIDAETPRSSSLSAD